MIALLQRGKRVRIGLDIRLQFIRIRHRWLQLSRRRVRRRCGSIRTRRFLVRRYRAIRRFHGDLVVTAAHRIAYLSYHFRCRHRLRIDHRRLAHARGLGHVGMLLEGPQPLRHQCRFMSARLFLFILVKHCPRRPRHRLMQRLQPRFGIHRPIHCRIPLDDPPVRVGRILGQVLDHLALDHFAHARVLAHHFDLGFVRLPHQIQGLVRAAI